MNTSPRPGDTCRAADLGRLGTMRYVWAACASCAKWRWVQLKRGRPASARCARCARQKFAREWDAARGC